MKSQNEKILDHLRAGLSLTPASAYEMCGTLALRSRLAELRAQGYDIRKEMITVPSGKRVGRYTLAPEQQTEAPFILSSHHRQERV